MKRILGILMILALFNACAAIAHAGSVTGSTRAGAAAQSQVGKTTVAANADAEAQAKAEARLEEIRRKAAQVSTKARAKTEAKLEAARTRVDEAAERTESRVAERLGSELNLGAGVLAEQRAEFKCGWGELMIAHALAANATNTLTLDQLFQLHKEGMGWGTIAAGLGLKLGDVTKAVDAETQVALGLAKPDGKIASIQRSDAGARAGVDAGTSIHTGPTELGAGASLTAGAGATIPKIGIGK